MLCRLFVRYHFWIESTSFQFTGNCGLITVSHASPVLVEQIVFSTREKKKPKTNQHFHHCRRILPTYEILQSTYTWNEQSTLSSDSCITTKTATKNQSKVSSNERITIELTQTIQIETTESHYHSAPLNYSCGIVAIN